jgi:hypothetical protein
MAMEKILVLFQAKTGSKQEKKDTRVLENFLRVYQKNSDLSDKKNKQSIKFFQPHTIPKNRLFPL